MATTLYAVPLLDTLARALSQAWARLGQRQFAPLARWQLLHIDHNGELQRATVDVLEAMPLERMILARCSPQDEPLAIQLGRIIEAIYVPSRTYDARALQRPAVQNSPRGSMGCLLRPCWLEMVDQSRTSWVVGSGIPGGVSLRPFRVWRDPYLACCSA